MLLFFFLIFIQSNFVVNATEETCNPPTKKLKTDIQLHEPTDEVKCYFASPYKQIIERKEDVKPFINKECGGLLYR
jgi:hypothetical protein